MGICAIPSSAIASGFVEILKKEKEKKKERKKERKRKGDTIDAVNAASDAVTLVPTMTSPWYPWIHNELETNYYLRHGIVTLILLNALAVILESEPEIGGRYGSIGPRPFDVFEMISIVFFTAEFAARLLLVFFPLPCNP